VFAGFFQDAAGFLRVGFVFDRRLDLYRRLRAGLDFGHACGLNRGGWGRCA
jgi:hypothetical protein